MTLLRKNWLSYQPLLDEDGGESGSNSEESEKESDLGQLTQDEYLAEIKKLRAEAKERRLSNKELKEKLAEFETQKEELEKQKLIDEGKKDELIKKLEDENSKYKADSEKYGKYREAKISKFKESLGDKWKDSYSNLPLEDLEGLVSAFVEKPSKSTDVDGGGDGTDEKRKLSEEEETERAQMGLSKEAYIAFKKKRKAKEKK